MKKLFLTTAGLLTLSACASVVDHTTQIITMRTPGATNARCLIENEDMKYQVYTDETLEIMKSPHDLVIRCQAPGNREQTVHVRREINGWVFANVANGFIPGAAYDYFSRGGFDYPETFTVSFVGSPIKEYPLPEYHNADLKHNNDYGRIEYMGPTTKTTEKTKNEVPRQLQKKEDQYGGGGDFNSPYTGGALDSIHRQYNPSVASDSYDPNEEDK